MVPGYIVAQMLGAFLGALLVYLLFKKHFDATEEPAIKRACFCTGPAIKCTPLNFLSELVGTFILVFAIKGMSQVVGCAAGVEKIFIFGIIVSVGMSLGGLTGYAINPARDLGPRIAHAILRFKNKEKNDFKYGLLVPGLGPIVGALAAVALYAVIPW